MARELLKVICQAVVIERDDAGAIVGELLGEPTAVYTLDGVAELLQALRDELAGQAAP